MRRVILLIGCLAAATGCGPRDPVAFVAGSRAPDTLYVTAGARGPIRIVTDREGIPHILAESLDDLYFAWGYVSARERLWQMMHNRAAARGERWRWMGNDVLTSDGAAQLFGFAGYASRLWERERAHPEVGPALARYAEGINAWIERCERGEVPWPIEFERLRATPERWQPEDAALTLWSLAALLDLDLAELREREAVAKEGLGAFAEARRYEDRVRYTTIPDSAAARLWPGAGSHAAAAWPRTPRHDGIRSQARVETRMGPQATRTIAALRRAFGRFDADARASNVFAVGPRRSLGGAPVLANDMHLGLTIPGPVMLIHVTVPGVVDAAGAFPPGMPVIVSGRNRAAAWGITALSADVLDVYADSISADGKMVRGPEGAWEPVRIQPYAMRYRLLGVPLPPFGQSRRYGPHGPIVVWDRKSGLAYGVRWTALTDSATLTRLIGLERSTSARELATRASSLLFPGVNLVAVDRSGDVRYQALGALPRRARDPGRGPIPGDGAHEWLGTVHGDAMPGWSAPPGGYIVNGNNLPIGAAYPIALPRFDWEHDRALRMAAMLDRTPALDARTARAIQLDRHSSRAERLLPALLACADSLPERLTPAMRAALDTLRAWDLEARGDRIAPAIFWSWFGALERRLELQSLPGRLLATLRGEAPNARTGERPAEAAVAALAAAIAGLDSLTANQPAGARYGDLHRATFGHPLAEGGRNADLAPEPIAVDGDGGTVLVGRSRLPFRTDVTHAPVIRHVVDLAIADSSWAILPPGNSGDHRSVHARDHLERWARGGYAILQLDWERITATASETTRLVPR